MAYYKRVNGDKVGAHYPEIMIIDIDTEQKRSINRCVDDTKGVFLAL